MAVADFRVGMLSSWRVVLLSLLTLVFTGCDQLGIDTPQKTADRRVAEAKAIGGACRHAMRAIEDCYLLNPKAEKSSVFDGWREMDEYMRENKLEGVAPVVPRPGAVAGAPARASVPSGEEAPDSGDKAPDVVEKKGAEAQPAR